MSERRFIWIPRTFGPIGTYSTYCNLVNWVSTGRKISAKTRRICHASYELFDEWLRCKRQMGEQPYSMLLVGVRRVRRAAVVADVEAAPRVSHGIVPAD